MGERLDLGETELPGVNWTKAHLAGARLSGARLEEASLVDAHLERAQLIDAHLEGAMLWQAHLEEAVLGGAHLEGAMLNGAHLERTVLIGTTELTLEQLRRAADPKRAHLSPEQAAWLGSAPAAKAPPAAGSEGGPEASRGIRS